LLLLLQDNHMAPKRLLLWLLHLQLPCVRSLVRCNRVCWLLGAIQGYELDCGVKMSHVEGGRGLCQQVLWLLGLHVWRILHEVDDLLGRPLAAACLCAVITTSHLQQHQQ